ncbi:MAG: 4Fe-4S dicluster domain-containing protein [Polyangiaceae bacterium]
MSKREPFQFDDAKQNGAQLFWKSLEEKNAVDADLASRQKAKEAEFPFGVAKIDEGAVFAPAAPAVVKKAMPGELSDKVSRRGFVKFGTAVTALFGLEACARRPLEKILPYTKSPEYVIPGISNHYASVTNRNGEAVGLLIETHEGRPTKIEGNPEHPASRGGTDAVTQGIVFDLYDPDRSPSPRKGQNEAKVDEFFAAFAALLSDAGKDGGASLRFLAPRSNSPSFVRLKKNVTDRFANARFHVYDAISNENSIEGARIALGQPMHALVDYARARTIVALDSDFLQTEPGMIRASRSFAEGRRLRAPTDTMSRLYVVEAGYSTTGANADHRLRLAARDVERYVRLLAKEVAALGVDLGPIAASLGNLPADGIPENWLKSVAKELVDNRGRAVVVAGSRQPARVHALAHALNAALGAVGQIVSYGSVVDTAGYTNTNGTFDVDANASLKALAADIDANKVQTLVMLGGNPVYDAPADLKFADKLAKVKNSIHLSQHVDETSSKTSWHVNRTHELEAWGDQRSMDGTWSIQQPTIAPLYDGISDIELLAFAANGGAGQAYDPKAARPKGADIVKETLFELSSPQVATKWNSFAAQIDGDHAFGKQWRAALQRGLIVGSAPFSFTPGEARGKEIAAELAKAPPAGKKLGTDNVEVTFDTCSKMVDGREGNNPWLLELPDPMTKIVWDNAALVSPKTAADLGVVAGDMIELSKNGATINVAVWIQPGQADNSVAVTLGWGRKNAGRYGNGHGFDVYPLRASDGLGFTDGVALRKTGASYTFSQTQEHQSMEGRPIAIDATLEEYRKTPEFAQFRTPRPKTLPLWNRQNYSTGHQWAMTIDLTACTGCNTCVIACQAENNTPSVGKEQVAKGREMLWMRIDRYFVGTDEADPQVAIQPVTCQQCEEAPCENVCPVNATTHSPEGLNDMAYNRCIGTRYCANNCPYKVRRFNYLEFQGGPVGSSVDTMYGDLPETTKMVFNPNVSVRMRGVMEKCTYCVQRIEEAKIGSLRSGKPLKDGAVITACQQACPTGAIVFGDLNEPGSRISEHKRRDRGYDLLADLGTHPRTTYLGKVRNPNKEMG